MGVDRCSSLLRIWIFSREGDLRMSLLDFVNALTGVSLMLVSLLLVLIALLQLWSVVFLETNPIGVYVFFLFGIVGIMIFPIASDIIKSVGQYQ